MVVIDESVTGLIVAAVQSLLEYRSTVVRLYCTLSGVTRHRKTHLFFSKSFPTLVEDKRHQGRGFTPELNFAIALCMDEGMHPIFDHDTLVPGSMCRRFDSDVNGVDSGVWLPRHSMLHFALNVADE